MDRQRHQLAERSSSRGVDGGCADAASLGTLEKKVSVTIERSCQMMDGEVLVHQSKIRVMAGARPPSWLAPCVIIATLCFLLFAGLGNTSFWDDEAQVGIIARNALITGRLSAWDGRNLFAYSGAKLVREDLSVNYPPLMFWVAAAFFRLLGPSTWAGRLPFALAGLSAAIVFYRLLRREFPGQNGLYTYALAAMAYSVPFLLFARNCRYYALILLFSITTFYFYQRCLSERRLWQFVLGALSAVLLFYSHYLAGLAFLLALSATFLVFDRRTLARADLKKLGLAVGIIALAILPYAFFYHVWHRPDVNEPQATLLGKHILIAWDFLDLNDFNILPWTLAAVLVVLQILRRQTPGLVHKTRLWGFVFAANTVFVALLSAMPDHHFAGGDVRYLLAGLPFCAGLIGIAIYEISHLSRVLAWALLAVLVTTNILSRTPVNRRAQWLLPAFIDEITHDYPTATQAVADFLRTNSRQDELFVAFPDFMITPLQFYVGDRMRSCCMLDPAVQRNVELAQRLSAPVLRDNLPDWLVAFGRSGSAGAALQYHEQQAQSQGEIYQLATRIGLYSGQTQRPEIPDHHFGPLAEFDHDAKDVYVFHRQKAPLPPSTAPP
jgi:4-amino-4-deoxy-L-arabinose transferase-like glycosyltransferase